MSTGLLAEAAPKLDSMETDPAGAGVAEGVAVAVS
jgi:hypothetical protein